MLSSLGGASNATHSLHGPQSKLANPHHAPLFTLQQPHANANANAGAGKLAAPSYLFAAPQHSSAKLHNSTGGSSSASNSASYYSSHHNHHQHYAQTFDLLTAPPNSTSGYQQVPPLSQQLFAHQPASATTKATPLQAATQATTQSQYFRVAPTSSSQTTRLIWTPGNGSTTQDGFAPVAEQRQATHLGAPPPPPPPPPPSHSTQPPSLYNLDSDNMYQTIH